MGKIIRNGIEFSGTRDTANNINYDSTLSGLAANTVQEAIDEVNNKLNNSGSDLSILQWYIDNGWLPAIPAEGEVPANLEDCSWHMIQQLVAADTFKNYYKVGDTKSVILSTGEVVYMQVASINDGSGDAGAWYPKGTVDFISKDCLQTQYNMHSDTLVGWNGTNLRATLNDAIYGNLPTDLQNVICLKSHKTATHGTNKELFENSDKLWLPTEYEMIGSISKSTSTEDANVNKQYSIFTNDSSRIKHLGTNGVVTMWWLSSPSYNHNSSYCSITTSGQTYGNYLYNSTKAGVPICFRVG